MYTFFFYTKLCKDFPRIGSFLLVSKAHEQTEQKTKKTTIYNRILKKKKDFLLRNKRLSQQDFKWIIR